MKVSVKCKVCGNAKELIIHKNHINKTFKCKCGAKGFYSKNNDHRSNVEVNIILINKINTIKTTSINPKRVAQVSQNINFNKPKKLDLSRKRAIKSKGRICILCGDTIPIARIVAAPKTQLCITCAENDPSGQKNKKISENFGTREDWKRDRGGWRKTH